MKWTKSYRLCANEIILSSCLFWRASAGCQLTGVPINLGANDAIRNRELSHIAISTMFMCPLHKLGPNRQGGFSAFDLQVLVIVHPNPNNAEEPGRKPGKPCITG